MTNARTTTTTDNYNCFHTFERQRMPHTHKWKSLRNAAEPFRRAKDAKCWQTRTLHLAWYPAIHAEAMCEHQAPQRMSAAGKLELSISSGIQPSTPRRCVDIKPLRGCQLLAKGFSPCGMVSRHPCQSMMTPSWISTSSLRPTVSHSCSTLSESASRLATCRWIIPRSPLCTFGFCIKKNGSRHPRSLHPCTSSYGTRSAKATP